MSDRRTQIIDAARELMNESGAPALSVRAVASRVGIGASTLRHYFPTQQELYDAAIGSIMDQQLSDHRINDSTVAPRTRLAECLAQFLAMPTEDEVARELWLATVASLVDPHGDAQRRQVWEHLIRTARRRVQAWVTILDDEGHLVHEVDRTVQFLLALVDGIAFGLAVTGTERLTAAQADQILHDGLTAVIVD